MSDILADLDALKADHTAALSLLEEAKASQESLKSQLASALEASASATAALATKDTELTALKAELESLNAELASLKANEKTAAEKAVEMVAAQGIKPLAVDVTASQAAKSKDEVLAELNRITDPIARADFYANHRASLFDKGGAK